MTMDAEKLVEKAGAAVITASRNIVDRDTRFRGLTDDEWRALMEVAVRIVVWECAAKAAIASLGTAQSTADRIQNAILSLSPSAKEQG